VSALCSLASCSFQAGDTLDGLGQVLASSAAGTATPFSDRCRSLGRELHLRPHAFALSYLTRAAFLSARNDVLANVAIIGAGLLTAYFASAWPDLIVGLGIFLMNLDAARECTLRLAESEQRPRRDLKGLGHFLPGENFSKHAASRCRRLQIASPAH
jgi:hypothetical protein